MFREIFDNYSWQETVEQICSKTEADVERSLSKSSGWDLEDFKILISPAVKNYMEEMAQLSHRLTQKRFGNTIQMYVPLYLSNECQNICTYCGFSLENKIPRKTLSDEEILREVRVIKQMGYDHILLVSGEATHTVGVEYFENAIKLIRPYFSNISIEVQPLEQEEYERLIACGVYSVLVYQETYHEENYKTYHPKGKKSNFDFRLETPERLGKAGIHKIGLGVLLGLEDWRADSFFCALHLDYLEKKYWRTKFSVSFPRIRPHLTPTLSKGEGDAPPLTPPLRGGEEEEKVMSDKELVQLICAYRIFNENVELSLSTRESEKFRDNAMKIGITSMSAGSKTNPGGYSNGHGSLEQFEINDERSPKEIAEMIRKNGYEAVWKDWDKCLTPTLSKGEGERKIPIPTLPKGEKDFSFK